MMTKQKNKTRETTIALMSILMYFLGLGMMIWSALSLSILRLIIGIIFIIFSIGYSQVWKKEKDE